MFFNCQKKLTQSHGCLMYRASQYLLYSKIIPRRIQLFSLKLNCTPTQRKCTKLRNFLSHTLKGHGKNNGVIFCQCTGPINLILLHYTSTCITDDQTQVGFKMILTSIRNV